MAVDDRFYTPKEVKALNAVNFLWGIFYGATAALVAVGIYLYNYTTCSPVIAGRFFCIWN